MRFCLTLLFLFFSQVQAMSEIDQLMSNASAYNSYFLHNDAVRCLIWIVPRHYVSHVNIL